ncbi:MAG: tRNA (adenosine(37)-N6)-threonylcarbamoyltransferase complex ATPase subunit type 1 TsaE [Chloroflexi bacterium]|nr:tRNA (adenosine(37)-N6)-threonylcarbamoyltransferase complex ATPase subunit type 1 TsaE [Chloroflexota bacterium]
MGSLPEIVELATCGPDETRHLGSAIGRTARPGDVLLLVGELGAGKTTLTQGIARGLGVKEHAVSPSFVLMREYKGRLPLYHLDLYRLERLAEIADLGLDDYLCGKGVSIVEWADRGPSLMPADHLMIELRALSGSERCIRLIPHGERYRQRLKDIVSQTEAARWNCRSTPRPK